MAAIIAPTRAIRPLLAAANPLAIGFLLAVVLTRLDVDGVVPARVREPVAEVVDDVRSEFGLPEPALGIGKLGRKVYVELHTEPAWDD